MEFGSLCLLILLYNNINMEECIFCKIVRKEIPKDFRYEDNLVVAFDDINPRADIHVLFVPKKHLETFESLTEADIKILSSIRAGINKYAQEVKLIGRGFKIVVYAGGAQTVNHLHFHLIGPIGLKV